MADFDPSGQHHGDAQAIGDRERLTADDLRKMRIRVNGATPGPWKWAMGDSAVLAPETPVGNVRRWWDRQFLTCARTDMSRLLDEVEALTGEVSRLKAESAELRKQAVADLEQERDDRPLSEVLADLRAITAASPEAQAGFAAYFADLAEQAWEDGRWYNAYRRKVEAAHADLTLLRECEQ